MLFQRRISLLKIITFVTLVLLSDECYSIPSDNFSLDHMTTQHGSIECIVHRESTLLLDLERWRGPPITLQTLPLVRGTAIKLENYGRSQDEEEQDILLLHRTDNVLFITLKSSALTLRCRYNTWGMFTFEFMVFHGRYIFSSINMNECEEIVDDVLTGSILNALDVL